MVTSNLIFSKWDEGVGTGSPIWLSESGMNPGRRTEMQAQSSGAHMELDTDKIDQAALALLALGRHEGYRAWKASTGRSWVGCI
jgi:hypothetical protein